MKETTLERAGITHSSTGFVCDRNERKTFFFNNILLAISCPMFHVFGPGKPRPTSQEASSFLFSLSSQSQSDALGSLFLV